MNGLTLAYIGDAYYELVIRNYLIAKGLTKVNELHNEAIKFTSSTAQAKIINHLINNNLLKDEEANAYKKGRNHSSSGRKNVDAKTYVEATGFESLIGFLYLNDQGRLNEIISLSINIIEGGTSWAKN